MAMVSKDSTLHSAERPYQSDGEISEERPYSGPHSASSTGGPATLWESRCIVRVKPSIDERLAVYISKAFQIRKSILPFVEWH